ncbi:MAG: hypothetical protein AABY39_03625 [Nitrospirota bacterium]
MDLTTVETLMGIAMILIGIVSLSLVIKAKGKLQEAGELKKILDSCVYIIIFLTAYSIWHVTREVIHLKKTYGIVVEFPEYILISLAYIMIYKTAKTLYNTANIFENLNK